LGFEYLNPARTFRSLRLMADVDSTLDHRAELMRKWSSDKALMAQAGLLSNAANLGSGFLGVATPAEIMAKRTHTKEKRNADLTNAPVTHENHNKPKKTKATRNKKGSKQAAAILKQLAQDSVEHTKKHKQNGHMNSNESVDELDKKITQELEKYKKNLEGSIKDINSILYMIEKIHSKSFYLYVSYAKKAIQSITKFTEQTTSFDQSFLDIANGLLKYVNSVTALKKIKHKYIYP
jgi:hypothetical protein